ncbi:MAG: hypothetical protein A2096_16845 [Spirochaetes bacterium GWF1_41_5]|nr:MAG: hypothetical protein A2096_16845 [Spirochaetes bacterium GWF1_41_5]HBE02433.1 hypothetical protein [Spirochaetia bacterium]
MQKKINNGSIKTRIYKMYNFLIKYNPPVITASNFIYIAESRTIRELLHPASVIDNILVINQFIVTGSNTKFTIDDFTEFLTNLPVWDITSSFYIKKDIDSPVGIGTACSLNPVIFLANSAGRDSFPA